MKVIALLLLAINVTLAGCVVHGGPPPRDRDGDGVPNVYDNRPNNPNRY